jgi:hypothetical protein
MAVTPSSKPFVFPIEELTVIAEQLEVTRQRALERYHALREGEDGNKLRGRGRPPLSLEEKIDRLVLVELARAASSRAPAAKGKTMTLTLD